MKRKPCSDTLFIYIQSNMRNSCFPLRLKACAHLVIMLAVMMLAGMMMSCSSDRKKFVIGVSQCSEDIWREKLNDELRIGQYINDSIMVRIASSPDDNTLQNKQINQFVDEGIDLLVVSPNQLGAISKAVGRAYDKGIPVILYDRKTNSDKYTAFVGCDNYLIGKSMGQFGAQQLNGNGRIVEICGLEGSSPAEERQRGFMDAIKPYPGIKVVASEGDGWKEESGAKAMKRILQQTQDFDYVFAHNDRLAWAAYQTVKQMGIKREYKYTGVDGMATKGGGLELVRDGVLEASYLYPTKGDEVIALAMKILNHQPFERENMLSTSIITKANVELTLMEARDAECQANNLKTLHRQVAKYLSDYNSQQMLLVGLVLFLLLCIIAATLVLRGYIVKARLNEELANANGELRRVNGELEEKNGELKRLNDEVMELTDSRLTFFTNISHELRTPLTLIADPVEMLLEEESIKGRSRELLTMVKRNASALQQLVTSILDFRKIQKGKMKLSLSSFDIVEAMKQWVDDFRLVADRKNIQLHLDVEGFTGKQEIIADKEKVARIVFNLMSNALKYTPSGGDIFVSIRKEDSQETLRIDVRDTGKGIADDEKSLVFDRFFQAKGAASGTGIGLALVKSFAELHHGEARVESENGKGADFIITLPLSQEGEPESMSDDEKVSADENIMQYIDDGDKRQGKVQQLVSDNTDRPTILIIDDNNDIRQYVRTFLQDDYFVLEAADGKEGLEVAVKEVPDLVICDVMMPVMDGLEFTKRLKSNTATSHIPVIMLTAKNLDEQRAEGYEYGADSYITKPFHSKVLLSRIENLLKQRQMLMNLYRDNKQPDEQMIDQSLMEDRDKQFMKRLHGIIHEHLSDSEYSVEDLGREIGLSRVQLYRKVKAMTGCSVVDLLRKARLAKAKRLLEGRGMSVSEVAYHVGFTSPSYFAKCFKNEYGILPGEVGQAGA